MRLHPVANSAYEQLFRIPRGQLIGRHIREVVGERLWSESVPYVRRALVGETDSFETHFTMFGQQRLALMRYIPDVNQANEVVGFFSVGLDITDVRQFETALSESEERLRFALDATSDGVWDWHIAEARVYFSAQWCRLLGYSPDEVPGTTDFFFSIVHPDDVARARFATEEHLAGLTETKQNEVRLQTKSGEYRWFLDRGKVVAQGDDGQPLRMVGTIADITTSKQAESERARLELQLRQAQKMESIGRLAGGVAHDFNNMLGIILGHTDVALEHASLVPSVRADLLAARNAATRSADIVRQLLAFARQQSVAPIVVDLNARIGGLLSLLARLLGEDIHVTSQADPALWPVRIDPSQLDQVLTNLCVNARKAIVGVGNIAIETANVEIDAWYCANHALAVPGSYVRLTVTDNGCGMDEETLAKIFEPFFTTSDTGEGIGLGLATVFGVVTLNRGFVHVTITPGHGASFEIFLPRHHGAVDATPSRSADPSADSATRARTATILVVEDEPALLAIATRMLESNGYRVLRAGGPAEALQIVDEHPARIDLLVTDVIMPGMNGHALARRLLEKRPGLRVLYMSGYPSDVIADQGVLVDGVQFLQKPFLISEFNGKVRDTLALME